MIEDQQGRTHTFLEKIKNKFHHYYQGTKAWVQAQPKWLLGLKLIGVSTLLGLLSLLCLVLLVRFGAFGAIPSSTTIRAAQNDTASEIYSADGILLGKYFIKNRTNTTYEQLSPHIVDALIVTEDARFFEHQGVDLMALVRVFFKTILGRNAASGGGSTLSQQLAKNLFPRKNNLVVAKIKEMYTARRLEKVYTKEELLNLYLNTVPFGGNIYGINVAAKHFFSTTPKKVKVEEAAMLIGLLKGNTSYNPIRNPKRALDRRNTVLNQMHKYKKLDAAVCDSLKNLELKLKPSRESINEGLATYFREHLRLELKEKIKDYTKEDGTAYNIYTDGLKIHTTLDSRMQRYAEEAVGEHLTKLQRDFDAHWKKSKPWGSTKNIEKEKRKSRRYKRLKAAGRSSAVIDSIFNKPIEMTIFDWKKGDIQKELSPMDSIKYYYCLLNAGFLVMNHHSGEIKAWVGGIDYQYFKYDHVKSRRQVGSTFKPIVYAAALEQGIHPCEYTDNLLTIYSDHDEWKPKNANGKYGGVYSMKGGLSKSVNCVAVDLIMRAKIDTVVELAHQMGITDDIPSTPTIALGSSNSSLYDMIQVYGTMANGGKRPAPFYITKIEDSEGNLVADFRRSKQQDWERVLKEQNAYIMTNLLQAVVDTGTAARLRYDFGIQGDIAGKTGTTQNHADGWFIGYTPDLVAGAWVGGESPRVRFRSLKLGSGSNMALPIWGRFMKKVEGTKRFKKYKNRYFEPLPDTTFQELDCPDFLIERPILVADIYEESPFQNTLKDMYGSLRNQSRRVNVSPDRAETIDGKRRSKSLKSEQIRKRNEQLKRKKEKKKRREERKDRRKKFWDNFWNKKN